MGAGWVQGQLLRRGLGTSAGVHLLPAEGHPSLVLGALDDILDDLVRAAT